MCSRGICLVNVGASTGAFGQLNAFVVVVGVVTRVQHKCKGGFNRVVVFLYTSRGVTFSAEDLAKEACGFGHLLGRVGNFVLDGFEVGAGVDGVQLQGDRFVVVLPLLHEEQVGPKRSVKSGVEAVSDGDQSRFCCGCSQIVFVGVGVMVGVGGKNEIAVGTENLFHVGQSMGDFLFEGGGLHWGRTKHRH